MPLYPKIGLIRASKCWLQISPLLSDVIDKVGGVEFCQPTTWPLQKIVWHRVMDCKILILFSLEYDSLMVLVCGQRRLYDGRGSTIHELTKVQFRIAFRKLASYVLRIIFSKELLIWKIKVHEIQIQVNQAWKKPCVFMDVKLCFFFLS